MRISPTLVAKCENFSHSCCQVRKLLTETGQIGGFSVGKVEEESELTERGPDPNKRTNKHNAEAGREGKAKGKEGGKLCGLLPDCFNL